MVPFFVPKRVAEIFLEASPYLFSANNIYERKSLRVLNGFSIATDQPGREIGLLGYSVGDMFMLIIPSIAIVQNMKFGILTISFLTSYELVEVAIAPYYWIFPKFRNVSYHRIDCLWSKNVSIINSVYIAVNKELFSAGSKTFYEMEVNVTIVEAFPPRSSNKIKIFDFCQFSSSLYLNVVALSSRGSAHNVTYKWSRQIEPFQLSSI